MKTELLEIQDLHASLETGQEILKGLSLSINPGETHVIMGPNGAGKSTLAHVIMGRPDYHVTEGEIDFEGEDITEDRTDERARKGIFLSFQAPEEVDGITMENFMRTARSTITEQPVKAFAFHKELMKVMGVLSFDETYANRYVNVGFSGGEKKKSEILQMLMLKPKLAILDETDSGLDVDAVKTVTSGIKEFKNDETALLIISHSTKLLHDLKVDYVHILVDGEIKYTGNQDLIDQVNQEGFARFYESDRADETAPSSQKAAACDIRPQI